MGREKPVGVHRWSPIALLTFGSLFLILGGFLGLLRLLKGRSPELSWSVFAWTAGGGIVLTLIFIAAYTVRIYPWGIRAYDSFGIFRVARWENMTFVERTTIWPWVSYAVIRTGSTEKFVCIWLPLFLSRLDQFAAQVSETAPPGNPLREFFERGPLTRRRGRSR